MQGGFFEREQDMTRSEFMIQKYSDSTKVYVDNKMEFYQHPSVARLEPFKIADRLYYVGDKNVCIHLVDTGDGLILIDSGYLGAEHLLVDSIWRAGFDPKDIKIILHTHGHSDHFGASEEFRRMYGCRLVISRIDAEYINQVGIKSKFYPLATVPVFDELLEDGDTVSLGDVNIRCVLTPGHTEGVMSFFFDTTYLGKTYRVGLFGGVGTNALTTPYMIKNGYDEDLPEKMLSSIDILKKERVDIHLGNHPSNNKTLEKRESQILDGGNPFVNENSWGEFLCSLEKRVHKVISDNAKLNEEFHSKFGEM